MMPCHESCVHDRMHAVQHACMCAATVCDWAAAERAREGSGGSGMLSEQDTARLSSASIELGKVSSRPSRPALRVQQAGAGDAHEKGRCT